MISIALLGESDIGQELIPILHQYPDFQFLGQFQFSELKLKANKPKLIILSLLCDKGSIIEQIKVLRLESKIVAVSPQCKSDFVLEVLRAGVHAYLWQEELFDDLPETLRGIVAGKCIFSESIASHLR